MSHWCDITEGVPRVALCAVRRNTTEVTHSPPSSTFLQIGIPSYMVLKWEILHLSLLKSCKSPIITIAGSYADTANEFSTFAKLYSEEPVQMDLNKVIQDQLIIFDNKEDIKISYMGL